MLTPVAPKKLFLLDAYALIYRAYFAFAKNPRVNSKGENTSAAFGFTNVLIDVLKTEQPTHIAVVFDPLRNDVFYAEKNNGSFWTISICNCFLKSFSNFE